MSKLLPIKQIQGGQQLIDDMDNLRLEKIRLANENIDLKYQLALIQARKKITDTIDAGEAQTVFNLTTVPTNDPVEMYINGVRYYENTSFTVNRTSKQVTWTSTKAKGGFDVGTGFRVDFVYYNQEYVQPPVYLPVE